MSPQEAKFLEEINAKTTKLRDSVLFNSTMHQHYQELYTKRNRFDVRHTIILYFKMRHYSKALQEAFINEVLAGANATALVFVTKAPQ